jgi:hypothetical protein
MSHNEEVKAHREMTPRQLLAEGWRLTRALLVLFSRNWDPFQAPFVRELSPSSRLCPARPSGGSFARSSARVALGVSLPDEEGQRAG